MGNSKSKLDKDANILANADQTYGEIPISMQLEIEKVSQGLSEYGPRKLSRRGPGMEFFESREYRPDTDEEKRVDARLSERAGKLMVIEREAEIRQHIYLWRDATESMNYTSNENLPTKKAAAEIMLLALARHLSRNEDSVGLLDGRGLFRGGQAAELLARQLFGDYATTGDVPEMEARLPRNSTVILFSDFLTKRDVFEETLQMFSDQGLAGHLVMVLDPQEMDFQFKGDKLFKGMKGEGSIRFKKAQSMQGSYQEKLKNHVEWLKSVCDEHEFKLTIQCTDEPLHKALLAVYGVKVSDIGRKPSFDL